MECLSKLSRWLFGVKWNRSEAKAKMEQMVKQEEDNASFLLDLAYQNAMKQMAEVPEEVVRLAYKYIDGEFVVNEDTIVLDQKALSQSAADQRADIDYIAMETGVEL